jgi:hypothetical protein
MDVDPTFSSAGEYYRHAAIIACREFRTSVKRYFRGTDSVSAGEDAHMDQVTRRRALDLGGDLA